MGACSDLPGGVGPACRATRATSDVLPVASGAAAAGVAIGLGGFVIAAGSARPLTVIALAVALIGNVAAGLAILHIARRADVAPVIRVAYTLVLIGVLLTALGAGLAATGAGKTLDADRSPEEHLGPKRGAGP